MTEHNGSILITGANGGLGSAFVANLIKSTHASSYQGIYAVRNPATAHDLQAVLSNAPKSHESFTLPLDLSSLESVRCFAEDVNSRVAAGTLKPIRALILNAAWQEANSGTLKPRTFTKDGFEGNFGINYLANFVLSLLLLESMDKERGRIVAISSYTHDTFDDRNSMLGIYSEEFKEVFKETDSLATGIEYHDDGFKAGMRRYGASKTLMVMFMYELQRRLNSDPDFSRISVISLDPGGMRSKITRNSTPPFPLSFLIKYILPYVQNLLTWLQPNGSVRTTMKSGGDLLRAVFDVQELGEYPKAMYLDGSLLREPAAEAKDEAKQKRLWEDSVKLARIRQGETALGRWQ